MTILFLGDVMGKIGRRAVAKIMPVWKKKYKPDFVIANGENLAHGIGVTEKTAREIFDAGVDFLTGGNHSLERGSDFHIWDESLFGLKMIRPANIPGPGKGIRVVEIKGKKLVIINLLGRVFFKKEYEDPFKMIDDLLSNYKTAYKTAPPTLSRGGVMSEGHSVFHEGTAILLDFHAEATSEKNAMGWYLDGKISAVIGTHTHIPTCDIKILPKGTAYVTDVGMVGAKDSVLGENKDVIIESFLKGTGFRHQIAEKGEAVVNAVLIKIDDKSGKAKSIKRIDEIVEV
jgi:calcineurin-like phosphoesterase